jgi:predicted NBD/HSP70 family sugar kinase
MPFQVVELRLDAHGQVIDRRAIPYPYPQRLDAVDTIEKLIARLDKAHHEAERDFGRLSPKTGKRGSNLSSKASNHVWIEATRKGDR